MTTTTDRTGAAGELPIQEVTRLAGTTSRTLRHYDAVGLLTPSRVGPVAANYGGEAGATLVRAALRVHVEGHG